MGKGNDFFEGSAKSVLLKTRLQPVIHLGLGRDFDNGTIILFVLLTQGSGRSFFFVKLKSTVP
jgi:hypothetical protein